MHGLNIPYEGIKFKINKSKKTKGNASTKVPIEAGHE